MGAEHSPSKQRLTMPSHQETRIHGLRTHAGDPVEFTDPATGAVALRVPALVVTETIAETYCGHCKQWIETNGVMGPIRFMARHRDGDCVKTEARRA
jgi:hypothetical protein